MNNTKASFGHVKKRQVPFSTQLKVLFGGIVLQIGAFFFWLGLPLSAVFVWNSEALNLFKFDGNWVATQGVLQEIEETNASIDDEPIYYYYFTYNVDGQSYQGRSSDIYRSQYHQTGVDVSIPVEYKDKNRSRARIVGMRQEMFSAWVILVLLFPLIGIVLYLGSIRKNAKVLRLLKLGRPARGKILRYKDTGGRINDEPIYAYEFAFEVDGRSHIAKTETHVSEAVEDEETELILYDPSNPDSNVVYDGISGIGKLDLHSDRVPSVGFGAVINLLSTIVGLLAFGLTVAAYA